MNCFNHEDREAIGICKSCQKGLCRECAEDLGQAIACPGACSDHALVMHQLVDANRNTLGAQRRNRFLGPAFFAFMGIAFVGWGLSEEVLSTFTILFGAGFLVFAVFNFLIARRWAEGLKD